MPHDDSGPAAFLARMSDLLDITEATTTEFDLIEISFRHVLVEATPYGGDWTFRVGGGDGKAPTVDTVDSLRVILQDQRTKPVDLGLYVSRDDIGAPSVGYLWLYRGHFLTPTAPYADRSLVKNRIVGDPRFADEGQPEEVDALIARMMPGAPTPTTQLGSSTLLQTFTSGLEARDREKKRLATFEIEVLDAGRAAVEYRGFDLNTREHIWVFAVAGGTETENLTDEVLATILDVQWHSAQRVGSVIGEVSGRSTVWLFNGRYLLVDNADADPVVVRTAIEHDPRFAEAVDRDAVESLRLELGESLMQREAREESERLVAEEQRAADQRARGVSRPAIPERVRHEVWRRDEGRCVDCSSRRNLEFDHIVPFSLGGADTARNLQLLCEPCNRRKGARI